MLHHLSDLNWLAVLAGTFAYFIIGWLWYSPLLFVKPWIKYANIKIDDPDAKKGMAGMMIGSFLLMLLSCIGLGLLRQHMPADHFASALHAGLLVGVCFSIPAVSIGYLYNRKPTGLYFIDCGYHVVGITVASIVMYLVG